jgi:hypothetical protein
VQVTSVGWISKSLHSEGVENRGGPRAASVGAMSHVKVTAVGADCTHHHTGTTSLTASQHAAAGCFVIIYMKRCALTRAAMATAAAQVRTMYF